MWQKTGFSFVLAVSQSNCQPWIDIHYLFRGMGYSICNIMFNSWLKPKLYAHLLISVQIICKTNLSYLKNCRKSYQDYSKKWLSSQLEFKKNNQQNSSNNFYVHIFNVCTINLQNKNFLSKKLWEECSYIRGTFLAASCSPTIFTI